MYMSNWISSSCCCNICIYYLCSFFFFAIICCLLILMRKLFFNFISINVVVECWRLNFTNALWLFWGKLILFCHNYNDIWTPPIFAKHSKINRFNWILIKIRSLTCSQLSLQTMPRIQYLLVIIWWVVSCGWKNWN